MKCPYCNYEDEKKLTSCPACGMIIKEYEEILEEMDRIKQVKIVQPTPKKKKKKRKLSLTILFLIFIFLVLGATAFMFNLIPEEIMEPLNPLIAKVKQIMPPFSQSKDREELHHAEVSKEGIKEKTFMKKADDIHSQTAEQGIEKEPQPPHEQPQKEAVIQPTEKQVEKEVVSKVTEQEDKTEAPSDLFEDISQKEKTPQLPEQKSVQEPKPEESEALPFTADKYLTMGVNKAVEGKIDKAQEYLNNALKLSPQMSSAQQYLDLIKITLKHDKGKEAIIHYFKAQDFEKKKKKNSALKSYEKALELYPDFPDALYHAAISYSEEKKWGKALPLLEKASSHFPDNEEINYNLGLAYMNSLKWHKAYDAFHKAHEINPDNVDLLYNLGITAGLSEKWKEADEALNLALPHQSRKGEIHYFLALANYYRGNYEQAIMHSQQAIKYQYRVHPGLLKLLEPYKK